MDPRLFRPLTLRQAEDSLARPSTHAYNLFEKAVFVLSLMCEEPWPPLSLQANDEVDAP